jgi:hypothetical protein
MAGMLKADSGVMISFEDKDEFPHGITTSKTAQWQPQNPITSFSPIMGYASSGPFTITITIRFSIEEGPVMPRVKQCRSLVVPDYDNGSYRPSAITLTIENYIESFKGVVSSVSEAVDDMGSWVNGEPTAIDVTITMEECDTKPQPNIYGK